MRLTINQCTLHQNWAISIDDGTIEHPLSTGTLITPKCCGTWKEIESWDITAAVAEEAINLFANAMEEST